MHGSHISQPGLPVRKGRSRVSTVQKKLPEMGQTLPCSLPGKPQKQTDGCPCTGALFGAVWQIQQLSAQHMASLGRG